MINRLAKSTANFINNNQKIQKVFTKISDNSAKVSVNTANTTNFLLRPLAIMATGKNIWDSAYSASSSIASGISETISSIALLKPFNKSIDKSVQQLSGTDFFTSMGTKLNDKPDNLVNRYTNFLGRMFLIGLVGVNSAIKMQIHPPLAKKVHDVSEKYGKRKLNIHG